MGKYIKPQLLRKPTFDRKQLETEHKNELKVHEEILKEGEEYEIPVNKKNIKMRIHAAPRIPTNGIHITEIVVIAVYNKNRRFLLP